MPVALPSLLALSLSRGSPERRRVPGEPNTGRQIVRERSAVDPHPSASAPALFHARELPVAGQTGTLECRRCPQPGKTLYACLRPFLTPSSRPKKPVSACIADAGLARES
jgi:hypothetical protein